MVCKRSTAQHLCIWIERFDEHLAKLLKLLGTPYFLCEQGELNDVEKLVVKFVGFFEILLLHAVAHSAMFAIRLCVGSCRYGLITMGSRSLTGLGKQQLIDDDVVRVNFIRRQFLH